MALFCKEYNFCFRGPWQIRADSRGVSLLYFTCKLGYAILHTITSISRASFAKLHVEPFRTKTIPHILAIHASTLFAINAISQIRTNAPTVTPLSSLSSSTILVFVWVDTIHFPLLVFLVGTQQLVVLLVHMMILTMVHLPTTLLSLLATLAIVRLTTFSMVKSALFAPFQTAMSAQMSQLAVFAQQALTSLFRWPVWSAT